MAESLIEIVEPAWSTFDRWLGRPQVEIRRVKAGRLADAVCLERFGSVL